MIVSSNVESESNINSKLSINLPLRFEFLANHDTIDLIDLNPGLSNKPSQLPQK